MEQGAVGRKAAHVSCGGPEVAGTGLLLTELVRALGDVAAIPEVVGVEAADPGTPDGMVAHDVMSNPAARNEIPIRRRSIVPP
ncbi:hypothetical protein NicSoilC12_27340 [Arthrobacter sp. NicSoilC12]|nr:hypothetical protein NicSoilC12_27340 [Arthrobacter sp. NicSoilC12]